MANTWHDGVGICRVFSCLKRGVKVK